MCVLVFQDQKRVSLFTSDEAEYVALGDAVKELLFFR